ncbi:MAG: hypothetical protein GY711_13645 [bacterium]|nr:hypothetical protein [bacterium]
MKVLQITLAALLFVAVGCSSTSENITDASMPFLGNETCPMSGEAIDEAAYIEHAGQKVYFCCSKCIDAASGDPAGALTKAYGEGHAVGNETCPISGKAVADSSGTFQGHQVGLCCADCVAAFEKKAAEYTATAVASTH